MQNLLEKLIPALLGAGVCLIVLLATGSNGNGGNTDTPLTKVDSLELRVQALERIYRGHLEECSFISKYDIEVGHDNYLRLRKNRTQRSKMKNPMIHDTIRY